MRKYADHARFRSLLLAVFERCGFVRVSVAPTDQPSVLVERRYVGGVLVGYQHTILLMSQGFKASMLVCWYGPPILAVARDVGPRRHRPYMINHFKPMVYASCRLSWQAPRGHSRNLRTYRNIYYAHVLHIFD